MKFTTSILISFLLVVQVSNGQRTIDQLLSAPFASNLTVSNDGTIMAWVFNIEGERNIYIARGEAFNSVSQITDYKGDEGVEIGSLQFTPDDSNIIYVRGNSTNRRGEAANPALLQTSTERIIYMISSSGGTPKKIADGRNPSLSPDGRTIAFLNKGQVWSKSLDELDKKPKVLIKARGGNGNLTWNPNGDAIAFVSSRGDHSFIGIFDIGSTQLNYINPSVDRDFSPVWSPDGKALAYISVPNEKDVIPFTPRREGHPWSIRIFELESGKSKTLWTADKGKGSILFGSFPSQKLAWAGNDALVFPWEKDGWVHLYVISTNSGSPKLLTPGEGIIEDYRVTKDGNSVLVTSNIEDSHRRHIWQVNIADGSFTQRSKGNGTEWSARETANGIAVINASATHTAWPGLIQNNEVKQLASEITSKYNNPQFSAPEIVEITATDGLKAKGTLFYPPNYDSNKEYPAVIFLHGGSRRQMLQGFHYSGYYSNAYALQQYFASQGYIALSLNFRSGIGYGLEFREADEYGITGASEVRDLIGAGEYLKGREDVDKERIALWGGSYGGFLTAHGLAQRSDLFAVGVDIHGVHNWNTEIPNFAPWYDPLNFPEAAELAFKSSPEAYLKGWRNPVLFIHGDDDRNVPFAETVVLTEQLRDRGVYFEQMIFPDEVHGFLLHKNWVNCQKATFEFIDRYIGN